MADVSFFLINPISMAKGRASSANSNLFFAPVILDEKSKDFVSGVIFISLIFKISFALEFTRSIKPLYFPPFQLTDMLFSPTLKVYIPFFI